MTQESIKKAVLAIVADRIPDIAVESVDLLGSRTSDFPNGGDSEMWASYLVRVGGNNDDIGIEVVCSSEVLPIAKVKDILRVDETQSYDVRNRKYIMSDDIPDQGQQDPSTPDSQSAPGTAPQAEPLRNQVNPDDPYTYYDSKGNLQPLSESSLPQVEKRLSYDDKGNPIWIYGSEDLG